MIYDVKKLCDLENVGKGHDAQHSQGRHSMANMTSYLIAIVILALSPTISKIFD